MRWDLWNEYQFVDIPDERKEAKIVYQCYQCKRTKKSELVALVPYPWVAVIMNYCSERCLREATLREMAK
ncbi:hypothetical protein L0244_39735 [bacterium]|nr:hypothetical protein [bacterium]